MPIQSKGGYLVDFDNLEGVDPFQGSNKMVLSPAKPVAETLAVDHVEPQATTPENISEDQTKIESALDETLPFVPSVENSLADISTNISSTESSVVTVVKCPAVEEQDSYTATPDEKQPANTSLSAEKDNSSGSFVEDAPLPAKGSYNFDFDNLDSINPFQTGGSKIQNSPFIGRKVSNEDTPAEENKPASVVDVPEVAQELPVQPEVKPMAAVAPMSANTAQPAAAESQPADLPVKEGPVKLEFSFGDGTEVKKKPPPKKFGKRPPGLKPKAVSDVKPPMEAAAKADAVDVDDVPKSSYTFDFDKFDDPNFNPFGTKSSMNNSPMCSKKSSPVLTETVIPEQTDNPAEKEAISPARYVDHLSKCTSYLTVVFYFTIHFCFFSVCSL